MTKITHHDIAETLEQGSHVKVETLVNHTATLWRLGVQLVVLGIFVAEVGGNSPALVQAKVSILQCRNVVLRVHLTWVSKLVKYTYNIVEYC
jgi:hypothetical protein